MGQPAGKAALMKEGKDADFRDVYAVGSRLGSGAFGTVYECRKKQGSDKTTYAVKMMEHQSSWWGRLSSSQDAQWKMFVQEFKMLKAVSHPQLVRMVGVFVDDYFVYFVMDKYKSSLINALLPLLKKSPRGISSPVLAEILKQMLESIAYMHSLMIVHRDVKADNYLVDDLEFKGRDFKVVLTDLSTARHLEEGVFLKEIVGTREYWAPELITRSYAHKVDVWAVGVILWCMITSKFPFATMQDRFTKQLRRHERMNNDQFAIIQGLLHKSPQQRTKPSAALENQWIIRECQKHKSSIAAAVVDDTVDEQAGGGAAPEDGAKGWGATRQAPAQGGAVEGEAQRFNQKLKMANDRHAQGDKSALPMDLKQQQMEAPPTGAVTSTNQRVGESRAYEWWSEERCVEKQVPDIRTQCVKAATPISDNSVSMESGDTVVGEPANIEWLETLFRTYRIDTSKWGAGQAKTVANIKHELEQHECSLLLRGDKLIRMVDLVVVRIRSRDGKYLVEAHQTFSDGRSRDVNRFPAVMCRAKGKGRESAKAEIARLLEYEISASLDILKLDWGGNILSEVITEKAFSQSYPGLQSVYRKFFFTATINDNATTVQLAGVGMPGSCPFQTSLQDGTRVKWEWWDPQKCQQQGLPLKAQPVVQSEFEGYQRVPGSEWKEESLIQLLNKHKIQTHVWGVGEARTLAQLVTEVNSGETQLFEKPNSPGELRRYLEILIVRVKNSSGHALVETAHSFGAAQKRERNLLPATKVRPFEDHIWAVRRLLSELEIPFSSAKTTFGPRRTEASKSPSYPGITTVYLKQVVEVQLEDVALENLECQDVAAKWYQTGQANGVKRESQVVGR
jgi:hypothetical protein